MSRAKLELFINNLFHLQPYSRSSTVAPYIIAPWILPPLPKTKKKKLRRRTIPRGSLWNGAIEWSFQECSPVKKVCILLTSMVRDIQFDPSQSWICLRWLWCMVANLWCGTMQIFLTFPMVFNMRSCFWITTRTSRVPTHWISLCSFLFFRFSFLSSCKTWFYWDYICFPLPNCMQSVDKGSEVTRRQKDRKEVGVFGLWLLSSLEVSVETIHFGHFA